MRISSRGAQKFPGNSLFQIFLFFFSLFPLTPGKKGVILRGGGIIIPGWSVHYIKHEDTILSGLWAVIFSHFHSTLHTVVVAGQNASARVMFIGFS